MARRSVPVELVVHTDGDRVDELPDPKAYAVCAFADVDGLAAEIHEIIFELPRDVGCEGVLDASAQQPAQPGLGATREGASKLEEAVFVISPGGATAWTKEAAAKYIRGFDQATNILLGIFATEQNLLVGILTVKINPKTRQALITLLVGEPAYRDKKVWSTVRVPVMDYLFDTLRLKMILASALKHNNIIIESMLKRGWKLDQTLKNHIKSNADGGMLDLCLFSLTRDAYRTWKKTRRRDTSDRAQSLVELPE